LLGRKAPFTHSLTHSLNQVQLFVFVENLFLGKAGLKEFIYVSKVKHILNFTDLNRL